MKNDETKSIDRADFSAHRRAGMQCPGFGRADANRFAFASPSHANSAQQPVNVDLRPI